MTDVSGDQPKNERRIGAEPEKPKTPLITDIDFSIKTSNIPKAVREDTPPDPLPNWAIKMKWNYEARVSQLEQKIEEYEMSLVQQNVSKMRLDGQSSSMSLFGGENNIEALGRQLALSPKFKDLAQPYREYISLLSLGMRLNPEFYIHAWTSEKSVKNKTTGKWEKVEVLNVMLDYKALLLKAKSERRVTVRDHRLTADEMRERGIEARDIEEGAISWVVEYYDLADAIMSKQAGIEYSPLRGYGFWAAKKDKERWSDQDKKYVSTGERIPNDVANGRDGAFMAWKRAVRALYYQIADMSLVFMPQPGMKAEIVDEDIYQFVPDPEKTVEGEFSEAAPVTEAVTRWQDDPVRIDKAAAWMDSLGVTDEMYMEATGTNWRTYDISADEFKYAVELLAESAHVEAVEVQPEVQPEPAPEAAEPPQEPPVVVDVAASSSEPPHKITDEEISVIALAFKDKHAMKDVLEARHKLAALAGVKSLINYPGTAAELQAVADAWTPEGQLL